MILLTKKRTTPWEQQVERKNHLHQSKRIARLPRVGKALLCSQWIPNRGATKGNRAGCPEDPPRKMYQSMGYNCFTVILQKAENERWPQESVNDWEATALPVSGETPRTIISCAQNLAGTVQQMVMENADPGSKDDSSSNKTAQCPIWGKVKSSAGQYVAENERSGR